MCFPKHSLLGEYFGDTAIYYFGRDLLLLVLLEFLSFSYQIKNTSIEFHICEFVNSKDVRILIRYAVTFY